MEDNVYLQRMNIREYINSILREELPSMNDDDVPKRRTVKVSFIGNDGSTDTITTSINGTKQEIENHYIDKWFNFGVEDDRMMKGVSVEFIQ